jgi:hypothetical protein
VTVTLTRIPTGEALTILLVTDVTYSSDAGVVVHNLVGRADTDFTIHTAGPRTGAYHLLCRDETSAIAVEGLLRQYGPFSLIDTATAIADRKFMPTGRIEVALDTATQRVCTVSVDYTEAP